MKNEEIPPESADAPIPREDQNLEEFFWQFRKDGFWENEFWATVSFCRLFLKRMDLL